MSETEFVWVFHGEGSRFASGVFTTKKAAVAWIKKGDFRGILTQYPVDQGCYDWAIEKGYFTPKKPHQSKNPFIQNFTAAAQEHDHFGDEDDRDPTGADPVPDLRLDVLWPDAEMEHLEIDYDAVRIILTETTGRKRTVICEGYIGYEAIGSWDEMIIESAAFLDDHKFMKDSIKSIKDRQGGSFFESGNAKRNTQSWNLLRIRFIDGHCLHIAAAGFSVA